MMMSALEDDNAMDASDYRTLEFARTVSRNLTHKRLIENVYVTSMYRATETKFLCGAYLPHANAYLNDMKFHSDDVMLKIIEIGRQIGTAICHEFMGVGQDNAFILNDVSLETLPGWNQTDWRASESLVSQLSVTRRDYDRDGQLRSIRADAINQVGGRGVCRGYSDWAILPKDRYRRMRDMARTKFVRMAESGSKEETPRDRIRISTNLPVRGTVLHDELWIGGGGKTFFATLKVDQTNLFFFDHANDHVPGMLMFEGMRQLALDIADRLGCSKEKFPSITEVSVSFQTFAEMDQPVEIAAHLLESDHNGTDRHLQMRLEARQLGRPVTQAFVKIV